jgi:hypothetical protein
MTYGILIRGLLTLFFTAGLLLPSTVAIADDDDRFKIDLKALRCYEGPANTSIGALVVYSSPNATTVNDGYSVSGRERGSQEEKSILGGTHPAMPIPQINDFGRSYPGRFRSVQTGIAGVDTASSQTSETYGRVDCDQLGDKDGVQVTLNVVCDRYPSDTRGHAVADLANHDNQPAQVTGTLTLLGRKGGGDFQELRTENINTTITALNVYFQSVDWVEAGLRRVRAELEIDVASQNKTIREREEASCPGGD